ncbi:endonuclease domain-containing protein [Sphingopyxis indica]|nr:endonuclease domain-containing protein [Sphingopyxis indica]
MRRPPVHAARRLRREMTLPEVLLWQELHGQKLGMKFRRQHPVGPYVADFCCMAAKLIVEIDGEAHNRGANPVRDAARDAFLSAQGFEIVRFAAKDVLENMDGVVALLRSKAENPLHHAFGAVPLPASGEEL